MPALPAPTPITGRLRRGAMLLAIGGLAASLLAPAPAGARTLPCITQLDGRCEAWAFAYDGAAQKDDVSRSVAVSAAGDRTYTAGFTTEADGSMRILVVGIDAATGQTRWTRTFGRAEDQYDSPEAVAVSPDGSRVFEAGSLCGSVSDGSSCDFQVAALDATDGHTMWDLVLDPAQGLDSATDVAASPDGPSVLVTGQASFDGETGTDYLTMSLDADTGEERWSGRYDGPAHGADRASAMVVDGAGGTVLVTGRSLGETATDIATVAYDADTGARRWVTRTGGGEGNAIALGGGRVFVAGRRSAPAPALPVMVAAAYDAGSGQQLWAGSLSDSLYVGGFATDVAAAPDGSRAYAAGFTYRTDGKGLTVVAFDGATGQRAWASNMTNTAAWGLGVSPDGTRVYATGTSIETRDTEHLTIGYDAASGAVRWTGKYEETGPPTGLNSGLTTASFLAMSPDGTHVYVSGMQRPALGASYDALTLAYQA
ncbi:MAG: PQQ-binding-like beta-propeller repeat protein [Actinomycetota bacterium]